PAGYMDRGTYQPIIPNCMPSSYPSGRFSLITLRTALSAARRSAGSAARYWATVEAVMLATIPAELCGGQASCTAPPLCLSSRRCWTAAVVGSLEVRGHVLPHLVMQVGPFVPALWAPVVQMMSDPAGR